MRVLALENLKKFEDHPLIKKVVYTSKNTVIASLEDGTKAKLWYKDLCLNFSLEDAKNSEALRNLVKDPEYNAYKAVGKTIEDTYHKAKKEDKKVIVSLDCSSFNWCLGYTKHYSILIPNHNTIQFPKTSVCHSPFAFDTFYITNLISFIKELDPNRETILLFDSYLRDLNDLGVYKKAYEFMGHHSPEALLIESRRSLGKLVAKQIDFPMVPYVYLQKHEITEENLFSLPNKKYAVKDNKEFFLKIESRDNLANLLCNKDKRFFRDGIILENAIETNGDEINIGVFYHSKGMTPLTILIETNKLFTNGSGPKTGTAMAIHLNIANYINPKSKYYDARIVQMIRKMEDLPNHVKGLSGWVDASFMIDKKGNWLFTEWMVRHAQSNWAPITHQFEDYGDDLIEAHLLGKKPKLKFKTNAPMSMSLEFFVIDLPASGLCIQQYSGFLVDYMKGNAKLPKDVYFDPCELVDAFNSKKNNSLDLNPASYASNLVRLGTLSATGMYTNDIVQKLNRGIKFFEDIPALCFRDDFDTVLGVLDRAGLNCERA